MIATLWTVTIVTANRIDTTVRKSERDVYQVLKDRFAGTSEDAAVFDRYITAGTFEELSQWLLARCEPNGDRFSVASHTIETAEPSENPELDAAYEIKKRGEYVEIALPHRSFGGERLWITKDGKRKVLINVD